MFFQKYGVSAKVVYLQCASTNYCSIPYKFTIYLDLNPHPTFNLIGWKQRWKLWKVNVVKYLKTYLSFEKHWDRRRQPRSLFAIDDYRQTITDTKCLRERPQDRYLLHSWAPKYILLLLTFGNLDDGNSDCYASARVTKTGNRDQNLQQYNVVQQVGSFCILYFATFMFAKMHETFEISLKPWTVPYM